MKSLIQLGCNNGSDISDLISEFEFILLVDANPHCIELAKERYKEFSNVSYEVLAMSGEFKSVMLYIPHFEVHKTSPHSSIYISHVLKHGHDENAIKGISMQTVTLNHLMNKYRLTTLEMLLVDCEAEDVHIINAINFDKFNIKYIKYEHGHASLEEQKKTLDHLISNGYSVNVGDGDTIAIKI